MSAIQTLKNQLINKLLYLRILIKKHPVLSICMLLGLILVFVLGSGKEDKDPHTVEPSLIPFEEESSSMTGVKESVDPRDVWTANIKRKVDEHGQSLEQRLESIEHNNANTVNQLQSEISELKALLQKEKERQAQKEFEESLRLSNQNVQAIEPLAKRATKSLGVFSKNYNTKKKTINEYLPAGTVVKGVVTLGGDIGTGSNTQSNPTPLTLRLTDAGLYNKGIKIHQIKDATIIGYCEGNFVSERGQCRISDISFMNDRSEFIEKPVEGWISGEDGRYGVKGPVVDKSSDMLSLAMLNGLLSGMSKFFENQATKGVFPISPISGQQKALNASSQLKAGLLSGGSDAFSKIAEWSINRFDSMSPHVVISPSREVTVTFKKGFYLYGQDEDNLPPVRDGNLVTDNGDSLEFDQTEQAEGCQQTMQQLKKNQSERSLQVRSLNSRSSKAVF